MLLILPFINKIVVRRHISMKLGRRSLNWRSFISLKAYVIIIFLVVWNVGLLYAMYMGGGGLEGGLTPIGMKISSYVYLAASIFSFSVAVSKPVQAALIAPNSTSRLG
jgi:hypothetical protein